MAFPEFNPNCIIDYYEDTKRREEEYRDLFVKELEKQGVFEFKDFQGHSPEKSCAKVDGYCITGSKRLIPTFSYKGITFHFGGIAEDRFNAFCERIRDDLDFIFNNRKNYVIELDGQPQNMFIDGDYCAEIARRYKNYTNEELPEEDMKIIKAIRQKRKKMNPLGGPHYVFLIHCNSFV